ncbi:MAG: redoxin domain-containing protein [Chloroflexi bacterium]|nr:redoxin domain-containing protein [Chloroflexota bacterium]
MLDQLAQNTEWFNERGVRVAAVTMGKPYEAKMFCAQRSPSVMCLSNPDQSAYQAYAIGKIGAQDVFNPGSWRAWGRVMTRGFKPGSPGEQDAQQLGATFIIGTDGKIALAHYNKYMGDHPEISRLKAVVNEQFSTDRVKAGPEGAKQSLKN